MNGLRWISEDFGRCAAPVARPCRVRVVGNGCLESWRRRDDGQRRDDRLAGGDPKRSIIRTLLTTKRSEDGQDAHAHFASGLRNRGKSVEGHSTSLARNRDIRSRAEGLGRWDASVEGWSRDNEVSDQALRALAAVLVARIAVAPALDGSRRLDEGVGPHGRRRKWNGDVRGCQGVSVRTGENNAHSGVQISAVVDDERVIAVLTCSQACKAEGAEYDCGDLHIVNQDAVKAEDEGRVERESSEVEGSRVFRWGVRAQAALELPSLGDCESSQVSSSAMKLCDDVAGNKTESASAP
jgi:hypothetical protein